MSEKKKIILNLESWLDPRKRCAWIFQAEMEPCPKCGSYEIKYQTPIVLDSKPEDSTKTCVSKWATLGLNRTARLEGPVYIRCWTCGHMGPSVDCSGRTRDEVGRDEELAARVRGLWNGQERTSTPS